MTESPNITATSTVTPPVTTSTYEAILSRGQFTTSTVEDFHNANDHSHDSIYDHDETEDDVMEQSYNDKESVTKEKIETESSGNAVGIFFGIVAIVIVMMVAAYGYKKYRDNRYRNQEFLLTDSVFRYDGYSQLDDA